jgi:hypothetical protein
MHVMAARGKGGGGESDEQRWKREDKEEQFQRQQELLEARRTGSAIKESNERWECSMFFKSSSHKSISQ